MFKDKKLLVTGGTGSIGSSICNYFNKNGCEEIFSTTTNPNKIKSEQDYIKFKDRVIHTIEEDGVIYNYLFSCIYSIFVKLFERVAQGESACLTRKRSVVQIHSCSLKCMYESRY